MKKLNTFLHNEKVQGNIIIATVFIAITAILIFTWNK
jgi:hypothetical protein